MILRFQGTPQRQPVLLPIRNDLNPDPNPSEPDPELPGGEKRKRDWRAASCLTIRRLILLSLLACPAWTTRCMRRRAIKDFTCTQVECITLNRHVRTNIWQKKVFYRKVNILLPCTHPTDRFPPKHPPRAKAA